MKASIKYVYIYMCIAYSVKGSHTMLVISDYYTIHSV